MTEITGDIVECVCGKVVLRDPNGTRWELTDAPVWEMRKKPHRCGVLVTPNGG